MARRLALTLGLFFIFTHSAVAQNVQSRMFVGGNGESLVLTLHLDKHVPSDGGFRLMASPDCSYSATITASDPAESILPYSQQVGLTAGDVTHLEFDFFESDLYGVTALVLSVSNVTARGHCGLESWARTVDSDTDRTRSIVKGFMHRRADLLLSEERNTSASPAVTKGLFVPGSVGESVVISMRLADFIPIDDGFKVAARGDCRYSSTLIATSSRGFIKDKVVVLVPGEVAHFEVAFPAPQGDPLVSLGWVLISNEDVDSAGACKPELVGRLVDTETKATHAGMVSSGDSPASFFGPLPGNP